MKVSSNQVGTLSHRFSRCALTLGMMLMIGAPAIAELRRSGSNSPPPDAFVCYWQTTDGRVLNLNHLCQSSQHPKVIVREITYHGNVATGQVVNLSNQSIYRLRVSYTVQLVTNQIVEQASIDTNPSVLSPGQTAAFMTVLPAGAKLQISLRSGAIVNDF